MSLRLRQTEGFFLSRSSVSPITQQDPVIVGAELGMSLCLRQNQYFFHSRSSVSPNSQQDPVTSWSLRSAVERDVEIARTGEHAPEAGEHAPRKERLKKHARTPFLRSPDYQDIFRLFQRMLRSQRSRMILYISMYLYRYCLLVRVHRVTAVSWLAAVLKFVMSTCQRHQDHHRRSRALFACSPVRLLGYRL